MHRLPSSFLLLLTACALSGTFLLYAYPILFSGCHFPTQSPNGAAAPFRLLVFGDPQLEGDSSLPRLHNGSPASFPGLWHSFQSSEPSLGDRLSSVLRTFSGLKHDIPLFLQLLRKRLDLWGNDYYLAHIYRTLTFFLEPTHVTVLGDLLGSQWIGDEEFERRGTRYWERVFAGGKRVGEDITGGISVSNLGDDTAWKRRIINVVGNHDIGYAGDIDGPHLERFERVFGAANYEVRFRLPGSASAGGEGGDAPELRILNLNSLFLDGPALDETLRMQTYDFINHVVQTSRPVEDPTSFTILLTHVPLYKEAGICVDGPMMKYYGSDKGDTLREQNHLGQHSTKIVLESIFGINGEEEAPANGRGRNGIILTGHDHEGCDVWHYLPTPTADQQWYWKAKRWNESLNEEERKVMGPGIREVTVRSMMGDFGGNAGFLSAWFEEGEGEGKGRWRVEYSSCMLGKQHWWWAVHVIDLITVGSWLSLATWRLWRTRRRDPEGPGKEKVQ